MEWSRARRTRKPVSLLLADVDHFKLYNDFHGHQKGDECLRAIASLMSQSIRPADLSARYGGEEFAVILPETDHASACRLAQKIKTGLARRAITHGAPDIGLVTLSMGVATQIPDEALEYDWLVSRADQALYAAKNSGRDRFVSADEALGLFAGRGFRAAAGAKLAG
jgi:diguanylate cyclase (GGDEF)-like protein